MLNHFEKMTGLKKFWLKNTRENQTCVKVERHHVHTFWTTTVEHWQGFQFEVLSVFHVSEFSISQEMDMKRIFLKINLNFFPKTFFFPKSELPNSGCDLSKSADYLPVFTAHVSLNTVTRHGKRITKEILNAPTYMYNNTFKT